MRVITWMSYENHLVTWRTEHPSTLKVSAKLTDLSVAWTRRVLAKARVADRASGQRAMCAASKGAHVLEILLGCATFFGFSFGNKLFPQDNTFCEDCLCFPPKQSFAAK